MSDNNQYIRNYKYAPGISAYGAEGKEGLPGENGKGCFFCTYNLNVPEELALANRKIQNNELLSEYKEQVLNRSYIEKDLVIDCNGGVYAISIIDPSTNTLGINASTGKIGEFKKSSDEEYFELSDYGRLYNIKGNGVDIVRTSKENPIEAIDGESNYVQRVYSDVVDSDSEYKLSSMIVQNENGTHTLNISFNKNDGSFHINSDAPIQIDCKVLAVEDNSDSYNVIDSYSKVPTAQDNISKIYNIFKLMTWNVSGNTLTIDTSKVKDWLNQSLYKPSEIMLHIVPTENSPIKKYSLKLQWNEGQEYTIGDSLSYDISEIGTFFSLRLSVVKNIEVFIQNA